jgi:hypothetical protein
VLCAQGDAEPQHVHTVKKNAENSLTRFHEIQDASSSGWASGYLNTVIIKTLNQTKGAPK